MSPVAPPSKPAIHADSRPESALRCLLDARKALADLLATPDYGGPAFLTRINQIIRLMLDAGEREPNVLTASILLCQEGEYTVRHAINTALITDQLLCKLGRDTQDRIPVIGAALTMNIGMHALQEKLNRQPAALTPEQRQAMQTHPLSGRDLLRKLGISDPLWLDCVAQHHETYDGNGYPAKLKGHAIHFEARMLGMADRYCAMLSRTVWRREQLPDNALLTLLGGPNGSPDIKMGKLFAETLGIYPAGSMVQLINGEIGVVKCQGKHEGIPVVTTLFNAILDPISPHERDTASEDYCIVSVLNHHKLGEPISLEAIWGREACL